MQENKCEQPRDKRKRCSPTLSTHGYACLEKIQELYGISLASDAIEFALQKVRYDSESMIREQRMILVAALDAAASDAARIALVTCLAPSPESTGASPR